MTRNQYDTSIRKIYKKLHIKPEVAAEEVIRVQKLPRSNRWRNCKYIWSPLEQDNLIAALKRDGYLPK